MLVPPHPPLLIQNPAQLGTSPGLKKILCYGEEQGFDCSWFPSPASQNTLPVQEQEWWRGVCVCRGCSARHSSRNCSRDTSCSLFPPLPHTFPPHPFLSQPQPASCSANHITEMGWIFEKRGRNLSLFLVHRSIPNRL